MTQEASKKTRSNIVPHFGTRSQSWKAVVCSFIGTVIHHDFSWRQNEKKQVWKWRGNGRQKNETKQFDRKISKGVRKGEERREGGKKKIGKKKKR